MNCFCRCYGRRAGSIYYKINNKVIMPHLRSQRARREGVMGVALRALALKRFGPPARSRSRLGTDLEICTSLVTSKAALRHTNTCVCTTTAQHSLPYIVFSGPEDHDTSTNLAHTILDDGHLRHGLRGPLSLPFSFAPEQAIRCIQLPRVRKEKDSGCFQGG